MRARTYLPRPEYPRPERQRSFVHGADWLNLNGPWEFRFDGDRRGAEKGWHLPNGERWSEQIIVPFCWEALAAWGEADAAGNDNYFSLRAFRNPVQVTRFNYRDASRYEVGWYRRTVTIPQTEAWRGRRVILTVGAADFFTDCWCNGQHLGRNESGYLPFEFDLTDALEAAPDGQLTATIVFRVEDPMENREQPVGKQWGWYSSASGIWQTVFIEPRSAEHIHRFEMTSDLQAREAIYRIYTHGGREILAEVTAPDGTQGTFTFPVQENFATVSLPTEPLILWDPNDPQIYRLKLTLRGDGVDDVVHTYFGMRSLSARPAEEAGAPAALTLNGEAIYIRGALYQSYHPEGIYTAGDVQALKDDILFAKRAGFDLLRIHIKIDDPLLLYYADTMGILLMADFPNFGEGGDTPLGRRRYEETMRGAIERDFNHPSIVAWCLFNETWGFGGQAEIVKLINPKPPTTGSDVQHLPGTKVANQSAYFWVQAMWNLAKSLDSTRLIEDMSVVAWDHLQYYGHGATDINSWHFYSDDYEKARTHIEEVVSETYAGSSFNYVPGFEQGTQPLINSEYGGVGALDGDRDVSWSFKFLTNELRRHGKLSAYIFTELHDVEWERNGFLNYDRTPKDFGYDPTIVNQGDVLPIDAPPIQRCAPGAEVEVVVSSSHFSRRRRENVILHWRLSGIDSLGWVYDDLASDAKPIRFPHQKVEVAERIRLRMPESTMLCTLWVRAVTNDGTLVARNYVQFFVGADLHPIEETGTQRILRVEPHDWIVADWAGASSDVAEAKEDNAAYGDGFGFYEWHLPTGGDLPRPPTSIRVLCEVSGHRDGTPQTDPFVHPTTFRVSLNDVDVHNSTLPNHPFDARGALTYLHGGKGAYGYLVHVSVEGELLMRVLANARDGVIRLRCTVPSDGLYFGGLTVYGSSSGRYPLPPTILIA